MPHSPLLWVNKDAQSERLSQSTGQQGAQIRQHVQKQRRLDALAKRQQYRDAYLYGYAGLSPPAEIVTGLGLRLSFQERRSLLFYTKHTAKEWVGWQDESFWNELVLQLSHTSEAVAHTLVSLGALHESLLSVNRSHQIKLNAMSMGQRDKAINAAIKQSQSSRIEALASCIALLCLHNVHNGHHSFGLLLAGHRLLRDRDNEMGNSSWASLEHGLIEQQVRPLFDRIESRLCMLIDPIKALEMSIAGRHRLSAAVDPPVIPAFFETLLLARNSLLDLLNWGCTSSVDREDVAALCRLWLIALDHPCTGAYDQHERTTYAQKLLSRAACLFGMIVLNGLYSPTEMVFDRHADDFEGMIGAVEGALAVVKGMGSQVSFGIDDGLVDILALAGQKCRHPELRRRAAKILLHSGRTEGGRLARTAGIIMQIIIEKEEASLNPVRCAADIREAHRVRLKGGKQYFGLRKICLEVERPSECQGAFGASVEQIWIDLPERISAVDPVSMGSVDTDLSLPDTVFRCGYAAFLKDRATRTYHVVENRPFFFPIPRA